MNLGQLKSSVKVIRKRKKIVGRGRGSGHGKTSCRGHKGQKARSGYKAPHHWEGGRMPLIRQLPKRGFKNVNFQTKIAIVNVEKFNRFDEGEDVTPDKLLKKGLVRGNFDEIKILGKGELTKQTLTIHAHRFSKNALQKINQAKGKTISLK